VAVIGTEAEQKLSDEVRAYIDQQVKTEVKTALEQDSARRTCRIVSSKGKLDEAYPPLILASTAAALGMDSAIFFTFYGLGLLKKDPHLKVDAIGNPAMPMPMPNLITALPGMRQMATMMMEGMFKKNGVPSFLELREVALETGVRFIACQMTMDVMGFKQQDMIEGIEVGGAAMFLAEAAQAHITLFI
jgi:peroxiredoxin family protein